MTETVYKIDSSRIVSEVIDGEAIIMDLESGSYYSADGAGAEIWNHIAAGASLTQITDWAARSFPGSAAEQEVGPFIDSLVGNSLLERDVADNGGDVSLVTSTLSEWVTPQLQVHKDMQDLIMLDPIHDVGEAGWPMKKSDMV